MVFSRTVLKNKRRMVQFLQKHNQTVAMTGEGTNYAPALITADIGIVLGIAGNDVAKQVSEMVLSYENIEIIVDAVEERRAIYTNMKTFTNLLSILYNICYHFHILSLLFCFYHLLNFHHIILQHYILTLAMSKPLLP